MRPITGTTALSLVLSLAGVTAVAAPDLEDFYLRLGGGFLDVNDHGLSANGGSPSGSLTGQQIYETFEPSAILKDDQGFHIALGRNIARNLSFEIELNWTENLMTDDIFPTSDNEQTNFPQNLFPDWYQWPGDGSGLSYYFLEEGKGSLRTNSIMLNVHLDVPFGSWPIGIYGSAGAGFAKTSIDMTISELFGIGSPIDIGPPLSPVTGSFGSSSWDVAWQWRAGLQWEMTGKGSMYIGFRSFDAGTVETELWDFENTYTIWELGWQQAW